MNAFCFRVFSPDSKCKYTKFLNASIPNTE